jgi:tetratricopeptide (TPR) repeat protein
VAIDEHVLGPDHVEVGVTLINLTQVQRLAGEGQTALATARRSVAIVERALGDEHPQVAEAYEQLGLAHAALGAWGPAADAYTRALAAPELSTDARASLRFHLAEALWENDRDRGRAIELAQQARTDFSTSTSARAAKAVADVDAWLAKRR